MLSLCDNNFWAHKGTHTKEFRDKFVKEYPKIARKDQYLISEKIDPMNLLHSTEAVKLEVGDLVIWSSKLLHEVKKNTSTKIRYTAFISYYPKGYPEPSLLKQYKNEEEYFRARRESYESGHNPEYFPSGMKVKLYSAMAYSIGAKSLTEFCDIWEKESGICKMKEYKSGKKVGTSHPVVKEWDPLKLGIYKRPQLTYLGQNLLG